MDVSRRQVWLIHSRGKTILWNEAWGDDTGGGATTARILNNVAESAGELGEIGVRSTDRQNRYKAGLSAFLCMASI
jgi:hypothetical protein